MVLSWLKFGQSTPKPERRKVPIEQLSHELALRFASKCYSHLEIAHFKDNFKTLADHQDDVEYWKEETLCRFFALPDTIRAGSVLYAMVTYLGAFPFPSLAPCIVTREAMLKVVTILTNRYQKILKRGDQDKNKLLFRSLAVFDRRASTVYSPSSEERMRAIVKEQSDGTDDLFSPNELHKQNLGFAIDHPMNDEEDEDDDDLALAALDALDAIEVFKVDHHKDRKIHHAHIPVYNMERLLMLLLLFAPLTPQDSIASVCRITDDGDISKLEQAAKSIIAAFEPEDGRISYSSFVETMTVLTPQLFRSLNPLFEHFMFSKQLDLSKPQGAAGRQFVEQTARRSPLYNVEDATSTVLNDIFLAQLAFSVDVASVSSASASSFFHSSARLNQLYSTALHGTSLSSFSRQVMSWRSGSILILKGIETESGQVYVLGAYLPENWKEGGSGSHEVEEAQSPAVMFQLQPRHAIFRANPYNKTTPISYFSSKTGVALGCVIPAGSRIQTQSQIPILGPVSMRVDEDISTVSFQHDGDAGTGAFLTDPLLEECQRKGKTAQGKKIVIDIDELEVWGLSFPEAGVEDEITKQQKRLAWEEAEAARRRGVNFGGDKDGARHLLEMAGIVNPDSRSGGSV